jgi:uncharacterized protein YciW
MVATTKTPEDKVVEAVTQLNTAITEINEAATKLDEATTAVPELTTTGEPEIAEIEAQSTIQPSGESSTLAAVIVPVTSESRVETTAQGKICHQ